MFSLKLHPPPESSVGLLKSLTSSQHDLTPEPKDMVNITVISTTPAINAQIHYLSSFFLPVDDAHEDETGEIESCSTEDEAPPQTGQFEVRGEHERDSERPREAEVTDANRDAAVTLVTDARHDEDADSLKNIEFIIGKQTSPADAMPRTPNPSSSKNNAVS